MIMKRKTREQLSGERVTNTVINLILIICGLIAIYPIWFTLIASISSPGEISAGKVLFLPKGLNVDAYKALLEKKELWVGYRNTILYTFLGTVIDLLAQLLCAYALSRKTLPGRKWINLFFVITMYFGGGMIPGFLLISKLGLYDSMWAIVLSGAVNVYNVMVAKSFFEGNIPESLFDAARIDGCSYTHFFTSVVLPLSKSIISILAMFSIQARWNNYMTPKIYLRSKDKYTLQQVIQQICASLNGSLSNMDSMDSEQYIAMIREQQLMKYAVVIVSAAPLVLLYPLIQKYLITGVMVGAVKE